jgi:hypothetical protein
MMARKIIAVFGVVVFCLGLFIIASPTALLESSQWILTPAGVGFAAAFRVTLGIILWAASDASRTPRVFRVLGVLAVLGGITLVIIGVSGVESIVGWGLARGDLFLRGSGVVSACLGAFLVWSTMTRKELG